MRFGAALTSAFLAALFPHPGHAGREPEPWDDLPQVLIIQFSAKDIGLVTSGSGRHALDRKTLALQPLSDQQYARAFGETAEPPAKVLEGDGTHSLVLLRTSRNVEYRTQDAYCSEGEDRGHVLWLAKKRLKSRVDRCASVSALEVVGNQLWLGTRYDGEYGEYPAEGVVVQSMDHGRLLGRVATAQGLTGDLIRTIRWDPYERGMWIATNEGINLVDERLRVKKALYVKQSLGPSGAVLELTPTKEASNPLVPVLLKLKAEPHGFFEATRTIPPELQLKGLEVVSTDSPFVPTEMNVLVPFFISAAQSRDEEARQYALGNALLFDDERLVAYLLELTEQPAEPGDGNAHAVRWALDKYRQHGLISSDARQRQRDALLRQVVSALSRIGEGKHYDGLYGDYQSIALAAKSLKKDGDDRGMQAINNYFRGSDGSRNDSGLYEHVGQHLVYEDGILDGMLAGLATLRDHNVSRGCQYFDMRWNFMPRRFGELYAEALLRAIERRVVRPDGEDYCVEAFKSQIANADVRDAFAKQVYPNLSPALRKLADQLGGTEPAR